MLLNCKRLLCKGLFCQDDRIPDHKTGRREDWSYGQVIAFPDSLHFDYFLSCPCLCNIHPGYSGDSMLTSFSFARSSSVNVTSTDLRFSSNCSILFAPIMTERHLRNTGTFFFCHRSNYIDDVVCPIFVNRWEIKIGSPGPAIPCLSAPVFTAEKASGQRAPYHEPDLLVEQQWNDLPLKVSSCNGLVCLQGNKLCKVVVL
jgi:hypothetical protein